MKIHGLLIAVAALEEAPTTDLSWFCNHCQDHYDYELFMHHLDSKHGLIDREAAGVLIFSDFGSYFLCKRCDERFQDERSFKEHVQNENLLFAARHLSANPTL